MVLNVENLRSKISFVDFLNFCLGFEKNLDYLSGRGGEGEKLTNPTSQNLRILLRIDLLVSLKTNFISAVVLQSILSTLA